MRIRSRLTSAILGSGDVFTLEDVRLDLRDASAPVTATISGDSNVIISDVVEVISSIEEALEVESTMDSILTRGDSGSVTVTIKEAFSSVFENDATVLLRVSGVPEATILTVTHAGYDPDDTEQGANAADVMGMVTLNEIPIVVDGVDSKLSDDREHAGGNGRWG